MRSNNLNKEISFFEVFGYPLKDIPVGKKFRMLNYSGKYMRVSLSAGVSGIDSDKAILVVDLMNGLIFYMSKDKPCYVEE